jgi:hypothetical protein
MKRWKQKALVQKVISYLPFDHRINFLFQKYVTRGVALTDAYFEDRLSHARTHLHNFRRLSGQAVPRRTLEIGTGWYPVVPIAMFLSGVDQIHSVDLRPLISRARIATTIRRYLRAHAAGQLAPALTVVGDRLSTLSALLARWRWTPLAEMLRALHIRYLVEDARHLSLPDDSIDLIHSNNTLEHIYPAVLVPILQELKRVVRGDGGLMSHFIDMSDHFAHFDRSITIYNFLRFSDRAWQRIDNSVQPQNRLRLPEYLDIYRALGLPATDVVQRPGNPAALAGMALAARFAAMPAEQIAVSHCHITTRMSIEARPA